VGRWLLKSYRQSRRRHEDGVRPLSALPAPGKLLPSTSPCPYRVAAARDDAAVALAAMRDHQREAFLLQASGANMAEESRALGLSHYTLLHRVSKGVARARRALAGEEASRHGEGEA
jgi:DNA-directed RNA polymerase specialized sigma24 family protein